VSCAPFGITANNPAARRHQNRPDGMQHALKRLPDPQGQGSCRPSVSISSTSPPRTLRSPRFTRVLDGKPLRRFDETSKTWLVVGVSLAWHDSLLLI